MKRSRLGTGIATLGMACRQAGKRTRLLTILAVVAAAAAFAAPAVPAAAAQLDLANDRGVTVDGIGTVRAPAEVARVQVLIAREAGQFSQNESRSGRGGSGGESTSVVGRSGSAPEDGKRKLSATALAPVLDAIAGEGVDRDAIVVDLSPLATSPGGPREESVRLDFDVARPTLDGMRRLVAAASDAASGLDLVVQVVGVRYEVPDCQPLEAQAERAATEDARARAERLARLLNVRLGDVLAARTMNAYLGEDDTGCGDRAGSSYDSRFGGLGITLPTFDSASPAEVEVRVDLSVTYAIVPATP